MSAPVRICQELGMFTKPIICFVSRKNFCPDTVQRVHEAHQRPSGKPGFMFLGLVRLKMHPVPEHGLFLLRIGAWGLGSTLGLVVCTASTVPFTVTLPEPSIETSEGRASAIRASTPDATAATAPPTASAAFPSTLRRLILPSVSTALFSGCLGIKSSFYQNRINTT